MNKYFSFKQRYTLQERKQKSQQALNSNHKKIPLIVQLHTPKSDLLTLHLFPSYAQFHMEKIKFLIEKDLKFGIVRLWLQQRIKKKLQIKHQIDFFLNGRYPSPENKMIQIYEKYKDEDGFLYVYCMEPPGTF